MLASLEQSRTAERRFLADASHELRTPVTALLGNVDYAARHGADRDVLDDLRHDAARLARLVDSLLALERGRPGGAGAEPVRSTSWRGRPSRPVARGRSRPGWRRRRSMATPRRCDGRSRT